MIFILPLLISSTLGMLHDHHDNPKGGADQEKATQKSLPERVVEREVPFRLRGFLLGRNFFKFSDRQDPLREGGLCGRNKIGISGYFERELFGGVPEDVHLLQGGV